MPAQKSEVSKEDLKKKSELEKTFKVVKRVFHETFGDVQYLQDPTTMQKLILKEKISNTEKEAKASVHSAKNRIALNNQYLQHMLDWSAETKKNWCSTHYQVKGYYECPANDLNTVMNEVRKNNVQFSHQELMHLTYQTLYAMNHLHNHQVTFDDFRPQYVGLRAQECSYMLLDRLSDPSNAQVTQTNHLISNHSLYMSPTLFKGLLKKEKKVNHDKQKSDVFSVGMVVLEAGVLRSVQDVYDRQTGLVNENALAGHLDTFRQKYGEENSLLCDIVERLLLVDESSRQVIPELLAIIPPYEKVIPYLAPSTTLPQQVSTQSPMRVLEKAPIAESFVYPQTIGEQPVTRVISSEPRVIRSSEHPVRHEGVRHEGVVRQEPVVIRRSHCGGQEPYVVREPTVRTVHHGGEQVVRSYPHAQEPYVVREPTVYAHGHGYPQQFVQHAPHQYVGQHAQGPVRVIRRGPHGEENVVSSGHHHVPVHAHTTAPVCRTQGPMIVRTEPMVSTPHVVHHPHSYVRPESYVQSHSHVVQPHSHVGTGKVVATRRISDPEEVKKYQSENPDLVYSSTPHHQVAHGHQYLEGNYNPVYADHKVSAEYLPVESQLANSDMETLEKEL